MQCPACGAESPGSVSCPRCGAPPATTACLQCGFANSALANFCGGCGRPLGLPLEAAPAPTPDAYTPRHLAERILQVRDAIQGERKRVTVMFADVRGSFELFQGTDTERVKAVLDATIRIMIEAVHRYEGTVAQVLGDGIMALFGAPLAHEDHAVRAAYAALAMHEAIRQRGADGGPQIRVGLDSGEVVIGAIGNDLTVDYRAVGATTHMAARIEQTALPGTTRLTAETLRLAEGMIQVQPLGPAVVKGLSQPVEVYQLTGRTTRTRFQAHIARGLSPFVGRDAELGALRDALAEVSGGVTRMVAVEGEPGLGKSRLCYELLRELPVERSRVVEVSAFSYGRAPFAMLRALLRAELEVGADDAVDVIGSKLDAELGRIGLAHLRPALASVLELPNDDAEWNAFDPALRRERSFEALRLLFSGLSESQPLVLLLEDLHWFDGESLAFLESLMHAPPPGQLLLLLTHRPDYSPGWQSSETMRRCPLEPLARESSGELVSRLVGEHPALATLRDELVEGTCGNPFFIEESVRDLAESRVLVGDPGAYRLAASGRNIQIPPSVESLIAARIDRLPSSLKELLRAAAVLGEEMSPDLLQSVLGVGEDDFRARFDAARELGMLIEAELFPLSVYRFRHSLIREVIYRGLLAAQRHRLHAQIVGALEARFADRLDAQFDLLADHSYRGQLWAKSVLYHQSACVRATTRSANRDAVGYLERGIESLEHLPASDDRTRAGIDLRLSGLAPLLVLGDQERMIALLREAEKMAEAVGDQRRLGGAYSQLSTALWMASDHEQALVFARKALALAEASNLFALRKAALHNFAMIHHAMAEYGVAIETWRGLSAEFSGELERKRFGWAGFPSVLCRMFLGSSLTLTGDFEKALDHFADGCRIADELDDPYSMAIVREELGYCHLSMGHPQAALDVLEAAMRICRDRQVYTMYPAIAGRLAAALADCGRAEEAIELAEDALARETHRLGGRYAHDFLLLGLGAAYLKAGRWKDALETASNAEQLTGAAREHGYHACALLLLGQTYAEHGAAYAAAAEHAFEQSLATALRHGMRPLAAQCRHALGTLYTRERRLDAAACALRDAAQGYAELGLPERQSEMLGLLERIGAPAV